LGSDVEGNENFSKYKSDYISKNFKFKIGMKLCSLKEAKQAIRKNVVLNGK